MRDLGVSGAWLGVDVLEQDPRPRTWGVCCSVSPASWPGLPRAHLVDDRLASGKPPLWVSVPPSVEGASDLLSPAPSSPQPPRELKETVPTPSHQRPRSQAGPAGGGGLAGRRAALPCPRPMGLVLPAALLALGPFL